nr:YesK-like family protein [Bacillus subtilis]
MANFIVTGIVTTTCLFAGVSVLMRMRFPDKSRPEWMLAGLIVLGVFAIWYSLVYVRGWEGVCARNAWIQCHFRSHCRIFDR